MNKLSSAILASVLTVFSLGSFPVSAAQSESILFGTPTVDGVVDTIYKQSLSLDAGVGVNAYGTDWDDASGKIYFLYDDNKLYICADIKDNDVTTAGEEYVNKSNPYQNDNCEFRLSLDGGTTTIKVGIDAYGYRVYGLDADMTKIDYSIIRYKTIYTDTGYVIECAIPCKDGILDLISAGKLGFKLQLNDLAKDGKFYNFATDYSGEGAKGLVYYTLSDEKAVVETETVASPATSDYIAIIPVAVASASALLLIKKRH